MKKLYQRRSLIHLVIFIFIFLFGTLISTNNKAYAACGASICGSGSNSTGPCQANEDCVMSTTGFWFCEFREYCLTQNSTPPTQVGNTSNTGGGTNHTDRVVCNTYCDVECTITGSNSTGPIWSCVGGEDTTPGTNSSYTSPGSGSLGEGTDGTQTKVAVNAFMLDVFPQLMNLSNIAQGTETSRFFNIIYRIALPIAVVLGMLMVGIAGVGIMTSEGDPSKTMNAKNQLTSAIIGLLFVLMGAGILRALISTLFTDTPRIGL